MRCHRKFRTCSPSAATFSCDAPYRQFVFEVTSSASAHRANVGFERAGIVSGSGGSCNALLAVFPRFSLSILTRLRTSTEKMVTARPHPNTVADSPDAQPSCHPRVVSNSGGG